MSTSGALESSSERTARRSAAGKRESTGRTDASLALRLLLKRVFDLGVSAGLLVVLAPVLGACALLVAASGRPVFFVQTRVGHNRRRAPSGAPGTERRVNGGFGAPFKIYKLRTMRPDAEPYAVSPSTQDDPRVTRLGRFLRATCLDEMPQLVNVLRGQMSLVGPRPEMPFVVSEYDELQRRRLDMKPGITGLWQIMGPRDRPIHHALEWDLYYIENWSFRLDLKILAKTLLFAFKARNR